MTRNNLKYDKEGKSDGRTDGKKDRWMDGPTDRQSGVESRSTRLCMERDKVGVGKGISGQTDRHSTDAIIDAQGIQGYKGYKDITYNTSG